MTEIYDESVGRDAGKERIKIKCGIETEEEDASVSSSYVLDREPLIH